MVVLVYLVRALLGGHALVAVVLVVGIHVPPLYPVGDATRRVVVRLALEVAVTDKVRDDRAVARAPLGLEAQVRDAHRVYGDAVPVHEHALVAGHGIPVRVVQAVGVVERAPVGRVAHTLLAHEHAARVQQAEARGAYVPLEADAGAAQAEGLDARGGGVRPGTKLEREPVRPRTEALERHAGVLTAGIHRVLGQVLHGKGSAGGLNIHSQTNVA